MDDPRVALYFVFLEYQEEMTTFTRKLKFDNGYLTTQLSIHPIYASPHKLREKIFNCLSVAFRLVLHSSKKNISQSCRFSTASYQISFFNELDCFSNTTGRPDCKLFEVHGRSKNFTFFYNERTNCGFKARALLKTVYLRSKALNRQEDCS